MFAARGIAISLSVFFLVYGALSIAVCCLWRQAWFFFQRYSARRCADLLFGLRVLPLAASVAVTFALTAPSFVLLEPPATVHPLGRTPLLFRPSGLLTLS